MIIVHTLSYLAVALLAIIATYLGAFDTILIKMMSRLPGTGAPLAYQMPPPDAEAAQGITKIRS